MLRQRFRQWWREEGPITVHPPRYLSPRRQSDRTATSGSVEIMSRGEVMGCARWASAFAGKHKDRRYYELVEDTIQPDFVFRYFAIKDEDGSVCAVQPFFIIDQDLLLGMNTRLGGVIGFVRRLWPRFMKMRTLMVGCAAGEGHLDGAEQLHRASAKFCSIDHESCKGDERTADRVQGVFGTIPGFVAMPGASRLCPSAEHAQHPTQHRLRQFRRLHEQGTGPGDARNLRRKFRAAGKASVIEMTVVDDVEPIVKDIYPLYLKVYERSKLKFEKLTERYFCGLGQLMPNKARFFVWHQGKTIVAFMSCLIEGDELCAEYIGLEYPVALDLHLYFYSFRDVVSWAIANGFKWYRSTSLNYDPKFHLKHSLDPVDLYVRHTSKFINPILRRLLPLLEPTRNDKTLPKFSNYADLWARAGSAVSCLSARRFGPRRSPRCHAMLAV